MKHSSDSSVPRLTHEGIANFASLSNFDKKRIEKLPSFCKNSIPYIEENAINRIVDKPSVSKSGVSSISVSSLITAFNASKHYSSMTIAMNPKTLPAQVFWRHSRSSARLTSPLKMRVIRRPRRSMIATMIERSFVGP